MASTTFYSSPTTFPPGVLTGRPMEMFEVTPTCDIYAVPEQWAVGGGDVAILEELTDALRERDLERDGNMAEIQDLLVGLESIPDGEWIESRDRGNHSWSATLTIAAPSLDQFEEDFDYEEFLKLSNIDEEEVDMEMEEALDAIDQEMDWIRSLPTARPDPASWIEQQLQLLERFQDKTDYYRYPMVWDGGVVVLHDFFSSFGIKEALQQFEEDYDYEEFLRMNNIVEVDMEMEEVLGAIDQEKEEEMDWIEEQLQLLERFQDKTDYYMYPMVWDGGVFVLHEFVRFGIKEALQQFEEDFDYEQSLWEENKACEKQKINLHRLLACEDVTKRPGWCGSLCPYDETTQQERYNWDVEMITSFPQNRKGYALGKTPYGLVFYSETFRNYHPGIGGIVKTTVALQDSQKMEQSTRSFPFTAIYLH